MIKRSADGKIQFHCDGLCRSVFSTGLARGKHTFIRAKNAAAHVGWQHQRSASGWVQFCPACVNAADPAVEGTMQNSAPKTFGEGFGVVGEDGSPSTDEVSIEDFEDQVGEFSTAADEVCGSETD